MVTYLFLIQMDFSFNRKALGSFKTIVFLLGKKKNNRSGERDVPQSKTLYDTKHFFFPKMSVFPSKESLF